MTDFTVPDMSCGHCVKTITAAIMSQDANATITTDLNSRTVSVHSRLADAEIRQLMTQAGYPPAV
ncbi:MAG: heavy-metal-associated domain-containing protein [Pseudohongiella sp.]|nr:heavy-metal-associated domain-containing protein [Pseudohongiella sp.]